MDARFDIQSLPWELLTDPCDEDQFLARQPFVLLSRTPIGVRSQPVSIRPRRDFRALVLIASPNDLTPKLTLDVSREKEIAAASLEGVKIDYLCSRQEHGATDVPPTLDNLCAALRNDSYDILYLVCHGQIDKRSGYSVLKLENDQGACELVQGIELVDRLLLIAELPRLVVLASCESAGRDRDAAQPYQDSEYTAAIGPRLAAAGIGAVVAMKGLVVRETATKGFLPTFFKSLLDDSDGVVDQAFLDAKQAVSKTQDWWRPVLYMRLRSGLLWYSPGFSGRKNQNMIWDRLKTAVESCSYTAVIGPAVADFLIGPQSKLAKRVGRPLGLPDGRMGGRRSPPGRPIPGR